MDKSINKRVAFYRKKCMLTQNQVAEMLDIKSSTYSQCEKCGNISGQRLIKIAEILGVDCDILLYGEKPEISNPTENTTPQTEFFTNKEKSLINVLRTFTDKKRNAIYKIAELTYKRKLDPTTLLDENS